MFLEINPLPHFHPEHGDFCRSAIASGLDYPALWRTIVENVCVRYVQGGDDFSKPVSSFYVLGRANASIH